jgi:ABC-2 type transport system permease protein
MAIVLRHGYVLQGSWVRILELAYWPTVQMVLWGFITLFFVQHSSWVAEATGVLVSAVLLWDVLFRSNLGVALTFMEEMWARNLGQLFVSPLRPQELVAAMTLISLIRTLIAVVPAIFLAILLYDVSLLALGPPLIAFFANLLFFGWTIGLVVSALILRLGLSAESLAWVAIFAIAPVSGIYYPIATLPAWLQPVSWALPSAYVFEGMRAVLFDNTFRLDYLAASVGLNLLYLGAATGFFIYMCHVARKRGLFLQQGE